MATVQPCGESNHPRPSPQSGALHAAWVEFIRYCAEVRFGEIERLKIQDGLPMLAEITTRKVKFGP